MFPRGSVLALGRGFCEVGHALLDRRVGLLHLAAHLIMEMSESRQRIPNLCSAHAFTQRCMHLHLFMSFFLF